MGVSCLLLAIAGLSVALASPLNSASLRALAHDMARVRHNQPVTALATLDVNPKILTGKSGFVVVSWENMSFQKKEDWIGMYCPGGSLNVTLTASPVTFKFASGSLQPDTMPNATGSIMFHVPNYRTNCRFAYITGNAQFPSLIAITDTVEFDNYNIPMGVHLALGPDPTTMGVMWTQKAPKDPIVQVCGTAFADSAHRSSDLKCYNTSAVARFINIDDFCDKELQPAAREGYFPAGTLLNATMTGLVPGATYTYAVGDKHYLSSPFQFQAPPKVGSNQPVRIVAFGDMGNAPPDGSHQHSWDFDNRGEVPAPNTTRTIGQLLDASTNPTIALHIGDISYAVGYGAEWDQFFEQIEPVAGLYAWQSAAGNHEVGYSASYFPSQDSGGECGVSYLAHFPFSCLDSSVPYSQQQPWYSFDYGNVHVTVMSTEHNFTTASPQWIWLEQDLASVDRTRTPWLLFAGHRPMYVASEWVGDGETALQLQHALEDMMVRYQVDLAIWGHFHAYQRTCSVVNGTCDESRGVVNIVMGMAGYELTTITPSSLPDWCLHAQQDAYGAVALDFDNLDTLHVTFVDNSGKIQDQASIPRKSANSRDVDVVIS